MTNIISGPWLHGATMKPRRRMTKHERGTFDSWLKWLARTYVDAVMLGQGEFVRHRRALSPQFGGPVDEQTTCEFFGFDGIEEAVIAMGILSGEPDWLATIEEPERPSVWPDDFHIAAAVDRLALADIIVRALQAHRLPVTQ